MLRSLRLLSTSVLMLLLIPAGCGSEPLASPRSEDNALLMEKLENRRVLWVAPHADDELVVAPVLGEACAFRGARCTLLLPMENTGWCPHGPCATTTDTLALRLAEHRAAARVLNAEPAYFQPLLPKGAGPTGLTQTVLEIWSAAAGGYEPLVNRFERVLADLRPDVVITHDPRHGNYCHPEHRVTAQLMLAAVRRSGSAAEVLFVASSTRGQEQGLRRPAPFVEEPGLLTYDASRDLSPGVTGWTYVERVTAVYESQFTPARLRATSNVPTAHQRLFLIPAAAVSDASQPLCQNR